MKYLRSALIILLSATILSFPGVDPRAQSPTPGGTLNLIVQPEPPTINLGASKLGPVSFVGSKIYEGLITLSSKLEPIPVLAESWTISEDGRVYTFKLRPNVKWHDGKPFGADDVVFSFTKFLPATFARTRQVMEQAESITAPDASTVVFTLKQPFPSFMLIFDATGGTIMPKHLYEGVTEYRTAEQNSTVVGTGPFKLKEWKKGSYIHLTKNPDYWADARPYLDNLYFHVIPDATSRAIAFETGKIDALRGGDVENFELKRLAGTEGTILGEGGWEFLDPIGFLNLNLRNKPLDDVRFRKALAHAIDRGFIVRTIFSGIGRQTNGPFTSRSPFKDTSAEIAYPYDPAKAKALLDEMGLKPNAKGVRAELKLVPLPYGETWQRLAEFIRERLSEIGVGVTIVSTDVPGWYKRITAGDFDLAINFVYLLGDPAIGSNQTYLSFDKQPVASSAANVGGYSNPQVDELLGKAQHTLSTDERQRQYSQLQQILSKDLPVLWTHEIVFPTLYRAKVNNLLSTGLGMNENFAKVWIKKR